MTVMYHENARFEYVRALWLVITDSEERTHFVPLTLRRGHCPAQCVLYREVIRTLQAYPSDDVSHRLAWLAASVVEDTRKTREIVA